MRARKEIMDNMVLPPRFFPDITYVERPDTMKTNFSFADAYRKLLTEIMEGGYEETNKRTGVKIKAVVGAHSFKVDCSMFLPIAGNRRFYPHIAAAETAWQFLATKDPAFILQHAPKLWSKFVEDGELKTAYGWRWSEAFDRDQIALAVRALREDKTNRQVFVQAWDPARDGLGEPDQPKNIPCPVGFALNVIDDALHMSVFVRSSDVFVGLPYDVMVYALTLDSLAASIGVKPGTLHFTLAHAHIYEPHWEATLESLRGRKSEWHAPQIPLPAVPYERIMVDPEAYVAHMKLRSSRATHNKWDPTPVVVA